MYERILRNLIRLLFWLAVFLAMSAVAVVLFSVTYLGFRISCGLLGYDELPMGKDEIMGWIFRAFLKDAKMANLFALGVSVSITVGLFLVFYLMFDILNIVHDKGAFGDFSDEGIIRRMNRDILNNLIIMGVILVPLIPVIVLDAYMFRYRTVAGAEGMEYASEATKLKSWDLQMDEKGDRMAWNLVNLSIWGYLAINVIGCLGLAYSMDKLSECWVRLWNSFQPDPVPPDGGGGGGGGNGPIPFEGVAEAETVDQDPPEQVNGIPGNETETQPFTEAPDLSKEEEVIGREGVTVTLAQALTDDTLWVDPETRKVWDRAFRRTILNEQDNQEE